MSLRHLIATTCLLLAASSANAGILTLNPDTIMPGKGGQANPTVVIGNATISYALDAAMKPILPNGTATLTPSPAPTRAALMRSKTVNFKPLKLPRN